MIIFFDFTHFLEVCKKNVEQKLFKNIFFIHLYQYLSLNSILNFLNF